MKIPQSVRTLYSELKPRYEDLRIRVDNLLLARKEAKWHYESRIKSDESFAMKLETGRVADPLSPDDFFACVLVVENQSRIASAEKLVKDLFVSSSRRPRDSKKTHLAPSSFEFDDLRLVVKWSDDKGFPPTGLNGVRFEIQIRTFLQHAWGIATHDFVYKADVIDWPLCRIAYQVKAMLENAELSISQAKELTSSPLLDRIDKKSTRLRQAIDSFQCRWDSELLPKDMRRLAETICELSESLGIKIDDLWKAVDDATRNGAGAKTLDLSPYAATVSALIDRFGAKLFEPLKKDNCRRKVFVPTEVELPKLEATVEACIIRPPKV
jgi:hypothetical protein